MNIEFNCIIKDLKQTESYVDMVLKNNELSPLCRYGQFLHIACGDETFLRRPISICDADDETVRIIFQIKGEGTKALAKRKIGDIVNVLGPLGHGFSLSNEDKNVVFIGGGLGVFPLYMPAKTLGENCTVILGYRNKEAVYLYEDFIKSGCNVILTTDDGSLGTKGFVTDELSKLINNKKISKVLTCGPYLMMKKVAELSLKNNIECQVSLEEHMGCGIGTCLCCVTKIRENTDDNEIKNLCVCKEGPVFDARKVVFS
ncbi:MAG: dihydroorotate dehydrogenase electron transfer subunit [Clostridia bacterium]|nr:dihydroorotate dehydrogenase electron transfer subunit [Clostridia bacterium]